MQAAETTTTQRETDFDNRLEPTYNNRLETGYDS